jgi:Restriction endonuclease
MESILGLAGFFFVIWIIYKIYSLVSNTKAAFRDAAGYHRIIERIGTIEQAEQRSKSQIASLQDDVDTKLLEVSRKAVALDMLAKEKTKGFPWLAEAYDDYCKLIDLNYAAIISSNRYKQRAAPSSAEKVKEASALRRIAEKEARILRYQLKFYESLFPWLIELRDSDANDELIRIHDSQPNEGVGNVDPSERWLSKAEYASLPEEDRFQVALDRYWKNRRSKWEIGRDYERYIGYEYEKVGYAVSYHGIVEGLDDLGRDLICRKSRTTIIVQCKNWSRDKVIHEKHVFQLYGSLIAYRYDQPDEDVTAVLVTTTTLSDRALGFARVLGIKVSAQHLFKEYPCIKCNVSHKDGTKIFHLPFDQQYDKTTINVARGDLYASTVKEATQKGFRRAYRFSGLRQ